MRKQASLLKSLLKNIKIPNSKTRELSEILRE